MVEAITDRRLENSWWAVSGEASELERFSNHLRIEPSRLLKSIGLDTNRCILFPACYLERISANEVLYFGN